MSHKEAIESAIRMPIYGYGMTIDFATAETIVNRYLNAIGAHPYSCFSKTCGALDCMTCHPENFKPE